MSQNQATIYSNGIAELRRTYSVEKGKSTKVSIPVRQEHLADVLASLTIRGEVKLESPPSFQPANVQDGNLRIDSTDTLLGLLQQLTGAQVEVRSGSDQMTGQVVGIQEQKTSQGGEAYSQVYVIIHSAGWLEGGLVTSFEKTILDHDLCGKIGRFFDGIDMSENAQALEAIAQTGPGQHFLGSEHTQANFMSALFRPWVADDASFEQWQAAGEQDAATRANAIWKEKLAGYEDPGLDPDIDAALLDYIAARKSETPDRDYF